MSIEKWVKQKTDKPFTPKKAGTETAKEIKQVFKVILEGEDDIGEIEIQEAITIHLQAKKYQAKVKDVRRLVYPAV